MNTLLISRSGNSIDWLLAQLRHAHGSARGQRALPHLGRCSAMALSPLNQWSGEAHTAPLSHALDLARGARDVFPGTPPAG